jgi:hypothetical protein
LFATFSDEVALLSTLLGIMAAAHFKRNKSVSVFSMSMNFGMNWWILLLQVLIQEVEALRIEMNQLRGGGGGGGGSGGSGGQRQQQQQQQTGYVDPETFFQQGAAAAAASGAKINSVQVQ